MSKGDIIFPLFLYNNKNLKINKKGRLKLDKIGLFYIHLK